MIFRLLLRKVQFFFPISRNFCGENKNKWKKGSLSMVFSFLRPHTMLRFPQIFKQLEKDVETVIGVLQPGPLGIIEYKFSAVEVQEAKATVKRAVANWRRNAALGHGHVGIAQDNEGLPR